VGESSTCKLCHSKFNQYCNGKSRLQRTSPFDKDYETKLYFSSHHILLSAPISYGGCNLFATKSRPSIPAQEPEDIQKENPTSTSDTFLISSYFDFVSLTHLLPLLPRLSQHTLECPAPFSPRILNRLRSNIRELIPRIRNFRLTALLPRLI
jgi:hypothetical protein